MMRVSFIPCLFMLLFLGACQPAVVKDYSDSAAILPEVETYHLEEYQTEKPTSLDESETHKLLAEKIEAVGWQSEDAKKADIWVRFRFGEKVKAHTSGSNYGFAYGTRRAAVRVSGPSTTVVYKNLQLIVEMVDPKNNHVIWQAKTNETLHESLEREGRNEKLQSWVDKMFIDFPPNMNVPAK